MQRSTSSLIEVDDDAVSSWGHPPHTHATGQFVTAVIGQGVLVIDDRHHAFDVTQGVWVPAGVAHAGHFGADLVPLAVEIDDFTPHAESRTVPVDAELRSILIAYARETDRAHQRDLQAAVAHAIDAAPRVREALRVPVGDVTSPIVDHLRRTPAVVPSLTEWAERLHTSVATIRRAFLAETGRPYSEWATLFRLELSIERLRAGDPIAAVARASGFSTNGYGLAFRRYTGQTPSAFRAHR